jgi:hypothetical protein
MKNKVQHIAYGIGLLLFLFPVTLFVIATLWLSISLDIQAFLFPFSLLIACIIGGYGLFKINGFNKMEVLFVFTSVLIIGLGCFVVSGQFYDFSFDGQWYHQDAIILLKNGWNPFYDQPILDEIASGQNANYINCYPKAPWTISACVYATTGAIEYAKFYQLVLLGASFFLSVHFTLRWFSLSVVSASLLSFVITFSPVVVGQSLSFYVDGQFAVFTLLTLYFICDWITNFEEKVPLVLLSLCLIYFINIKFTGLVYSLVFLFFAFSLVLWKDRGRVLKMVLKLSVVMTVAIFVFGFPTYGTNILHKGHPFYPIMGKNNEGEKIAAAQYPKNFFGKNRFEKLYLASFALPNYTAPKTHPSIPKRLFSSNVIKASLPYYRNHQPVEMSALGPLQAELLILLLPLFFLSFLFYRKSWIYILFFGLATSCVIQPECWNYRYVPQLLFIYLLVIIPVLLSKYWLIKFYGHLLLVGFSVSFMFAHLQYYQWNAEKTALLNKSFAALKNKPYHLKKGWMMSFGVKLEERNLLQFAQPSTPQDTLKNFKGDDVTGWLYTFVE